MLMITSPRNATGTWRKGTATSCTWPAAVGSPQAALPASKISQQPFQHHLQPIEPPQASLHRTSVIVGTRQRKRNPFVDIERDVLPDGKPNTPWRRLKLRIQQALSVQALISIFLNHHHKTNVWRPIHSAGIIMRLGALHYYRLLQNPRLSPDTSAKTLELLNLLAPDLTKPQVMHILDAARLCQVLVVISAVNPKPPTNLVDPIVRELLRQGGKKMPMTKPDLLAELAAGLVRLGWWEQDLWLVVVAAAAAALLTQQQRLQQQQQQQQSGQSGHVGQIGVLDDGLLQESPWADDDIEQQQQEQDEGEDLLLDQVPWQQQQQWQDPEEDDYVKWEQQQWEQWQQQQQQGLDSLSDPPLQLLQTGDPPVQQSSMLQQQQQQSLQLEALTEFQWEEEQQQEEQQEWLEEQHWYDTSWQQQQQSDYESDWLNAPEMHQYVEEQQQDEQQQEVPLADSSSSSRFGPHWLSADFPKMAAALAAAAAAFEHQQQSVSKGTPVRSSNLTLRSSIEEVMELLGTLSVRYLVLLTPAELADLSGAYAILGLRHHELLTGTSKALVDKIQYLTSSLSNHNASWQQQQQWGVGNADNAGSSSAAESDLAAVIRAADGLCQLGYADQALVTAVQTFVLHSSSSTGLGTSLTVEQLVQLLQLVALSGSSSSSSSGGGNVTPLSNLVCDAIAASGLDALDPEQLRTAAAALVELQQQQQLPEAAAAMSVIGAAATARAARCGPGVLCEVLWGCVMLGCYNELLAEVTVAAVEQAAGTPSRQKSRSKKQRLVAATATAAAAHGNVHTGSSGQSGQYSGLTSKHQAQLLWALQQMQRLDLADRVLAAVQIGSTVGDATLNVEPGVPVF